jgi:4-aminobutyrate aminotransferase-like enzyme/Ser/Thr protein kinase RdoA (MazF antagonist)
MVSMEENIRPPFSTDEAIKILKLYYDIQVQTIEELSAELDRNFYVLSEDHQEYILKVAHASYVDAVLDLQNATLQYLGQSRDLFPKLIPTSEGQYAVNIEGIDGHIYIIRLLHYIVGTPLVDFQPHSPELLNDIGTQLGHLSSVMQSFSHPEKRLNYRWNILNALDIVSYSDEMPHEKRAIIHKYMDLYEQQFLPNLSSVRHSFIHNDANDHNILVQSHSLDQSSLAGLIDFGDLVYSPTIAELAVCLAYVMMHSDQPLDKAVKVVKGYHRIFPLTELEISMLYPLLTARLCMSVCISWYQQQNEPDNPHLSISEAPAWDLLYQLRDIHPRLAHYIFRDACGFNANPYTEAIVSWLQEQSFHPILNRPITLDNSIMLDLSISSTELGNVDEFANIPNFTHQIFSRLTEGQIAIGRYNEARPIYLGDMFAVDHHERRAIHIGLDLFDHAGTPIYAPLAGRVYSVHDIQGDKDYGPTLILKHQPSPDITFFTLYGHLGVSILEQWTVGDAVTAGEQLAVMGDYPNNGNWPPHVHFQIITDMLDNTIEFPGVIAPRHRTAWLSLSPNPNLITNLAQEIEATTVNKLQEIITIREKHLNPSMSISYNTPLQIQRGYMHYLYDENGQAYLDCVNNVPHVGHSNPRVVKAGQGQMAVLNTNTRYLHNTITDYAQRLCETLPESLPVCFLVNSGSEANELAIRLAQAYTGGADFVVIDHAYHGNTSSTLELSPYKFNGKGGSGKPNHIEIATMPDGYRGEKRGFDAEVGRYYAQSVQTALDNIQQKGSKVAGFFAEAILGCGGQMTLPDDYLKTSYDMVRMAGGLCIADEVQIGFGRVGTHFWAFETQGVTPDIVTMGKPIGNGHPFGAVVTTRAIADAFNNGMEYFNTFGGNPVSCAIGLEVLTIIEDDNLQKNALNVGNYWKAQLHQLQVTYPIIGHIRGAGLFLGVELIRNRDMLEPADTETAYIIERMKQKGFLLSTEGPLHNVVKIKPPIIFTREHVDLFMIAFEDVLRDTALRVLLK